MCFYHKNHGKLEMKKNPVIDGQIFYNLSFNGKEYLRNNSWSHSLYIKLTRLES